MNEAIKIARGGTYLGTVGRVATIVGLLIQYT